MVWRIHNGNNDPNTFRAYQDPLYFWANWDIRGFGGSDTLHGSEQRDKIFGHSGNDRIYGRGGNDYVSGSTGEDYVYGGSGNDEVRGGDDNDYLSGGDDNDDLYAEDGNDILYGGHGRDKMLGGEGDDTYELKDIMDDFYDEIVEYSNQGTDLINAAWSYSLASIPHVENLTLTGTARDGTGNNLRNEITGNSRNNTLDGGAGVDRLIGGDGNDIYIVDRTEDEVVENSNAGIDEIQSSTYNYTLPVNVENLTLIENGRNGYGNYQDNTLQGNRRNNRLEGGNGQDKLTGTSEYTSDYQIDYLTGGNGGDGFYLGTRNNSYYQSSILNDNDATNNYLDTYGKYQYAVITDFEDGVDRIYLEGQVGDYELGNTTVGGGGVGIYLDRDNSNSIGIEDDLIAIVKGDNDNLSLSNGTQFLYL
ncbi:MAG: hypothetical protein Tsb0014_22340 [Pleurocapsa sp.]